MHWLKEKYGVMVLVTTLGLVLDQLTKSLIIHHLPVRAGVSIIPGFFDLYHVHNPGASFGLFRGNPLLFFLIASSLAIGLILYYFIKLERNNLMMSAALALILSGAVGNNLLDRVRHGFVIDFLRLYMNDYSWPTFNVADMAIVFGVGLFALYTVRTEMHLRKTQGSNTEAVRS